MSQQQLVVDLKSSRETAKNALIEIYAKISKCKDNSKSKSTFAYNGVHAICMAIKDNGRYYEIYADGITKLVVYISEAHWNMFVELLRFILGEFYSKNLLHESVPLAVLVQAERIATAADVKSHLKLYSRQLLYTHTVMSDEEIKDIFNRIALLLAKCKSMQFADLIPDFQTHFLGCPSMLQSVVVKHIDKVNHLFETFFKAITAHKIEGNDTFIVLMKFLLNFLQLDVTDKNTVFSQNFLRSCKENQSLKEHKYQHYAINMFYYFVKLLLFPNALDFNRNFVDIIGKFTLFLDRVDLAKETWFMDTIVTLTRILDAVKGQKVIFQTMNEDSYQEVFSLIEKLVKLAHGVSYESGLWTCCNSVRKHVIFRLCMVELVMLETIVEKGVSKAPLCLSVYAILKHTIAVAEYFKCSTLSYEVASIMNSLVRCAQNVKTKEDGDHLVKMLLLTTKVKDHLPENSMKTVTKCVMHVYKAVGNTKGQAEACSLYITHLMATKADSDLIRRYMAMFYSLEPCMSILENLDSCTSLLKNDGFSRRLLHSMEAGVFFKLRDNNILTITSLLKSAETTLDFVLVARQYPQVNFSAKLDRKYTELRGKSPLTPEQHLAFGHICKHRALLQMDELKNIFGVPKIIDESLPKVLDPTKLKLMDLASEMQIINLAKEGVDSFLKFFEYAINNPLPEVSVDWEPIIDDIAMLARLFHFRGYLDYAYTSWRLLLQISTHLDDILNRIRALTFICDECQFVKLYDPQFDIEAEIKNCDKGLLDCLLNMEFLTPRRQNYVLTCLCYIGWYFAQESRFTESQLLLDLALEKVEELIDRKNKFEFLRATHLAVTFRIQWKLQEALSKIGAFSQVDKILDEIRAVVYFTSEDSLNFPTLLFAVVSDVTEFTTNRLCEPATIPYVQMVLKMALDAGAAYRVVQFLGVWTHINLQSENVNKCQIKLDLIDALLRNNAQPSNSTMKASQKLRNHLDVATLEPYCIYGEELTVRKAAYVNPISPVRIKYKAPIVLRSLEDFLITHQRSCTCDKCSHTFLRWQYFKIGCLNARLLYLGEVYGEPSKFYAKAVEWCDKSVHKAHTKFHFREYEITMLTQHINLLRRMGEFSAALAVSKCSLEIFDQFKGGLDGAYFVNLSIQSASTAAEMLKQPTKVNHTMRRVLKFSPSSLSATSVKPKAVTTVRRGRTKKESPKTSRENIESIIYNDCTTPAIPKTRPRPKDRAKSVPPPRRAKKTDKPVEEICKIVECIHLDDDVPKKSTHTATSTRRGRAKANLNTAIIIIDDDDDDDSPPPTTTRKIPKSASKAEYTPLTRGRPKKAPPATVAGAKSAAAESRSKLLRRRI